MGFPWTFVAKETDLGVKKPERKSCRTISAGNFNSWQVVNMSTAECRATSKYTFIIEENGNEKKGFLH